jgi:hypothetical protein
LFFYQTEQIIRGVVGSAIGLLFKEDMRAMLELNEGLEEFCAF